MKYLKTFESIEYDIIPKEVQDQIKDILIELDDLGYIITYSWIPYNRKWLDNTSTIYFNKYNYTPLKGEEITPIINRLKDYLDYIGYDVTDLDIPKLRIQLYLQFHKSKDGQIKVSTSTKISQLNSRDYFDTKLFVDSFNYDDKPKPKEIRNQIEDILLDLKDIGYNVKIFVYGETEQDLTQDLTIIINKHNYSALGEELKPIIDRLKAYLDYIGYDTTKLTASPIDPRESQNKYTRNNIHQIHINIDDDGDDVKVTSVLSF